MRWSCSCSCISSFDKKEQDAGNHQLCQRTLIAMFSQVLIIFLDLIRWTAVGSHPTHVMLMGLHLLLKLRLLCAMITTITTSVCWIALFLLMVTIPHLGSRHSFAPLPVAAEMIDPLKNQSKPPVAARRRKLPCRLVSWSLVVVETSSTPRSRSMLWWISVRTIFQLERMSGSASLIDTTNFSQVDLDRRRVFMVSSTVMQNRSPSNRSPWLSSSCCTCQEGHEENPGESLNQHPRWPSSFGKAWTSSGEWRRLSKEVCGQCYQQQRQ